MASLTLPHMAAAIPPDPAKPNDSRRLALIALFVVLVIALPVGVSVGMSWIELPEAGDETSRAAPEWVPLPQVRATTSDGTVVKARVALDVDGVAARSAIQRNVQQVGLLLEVSIASRTREQLAAPDGIGRLSDDMRARLNAYLGSADAVRSVAIQDLLVKPQ